MPSPNDTQIRKGFFYVIFASLLWGVSGVFGQFLIQDRQISPEWLVSLRLLIPGVILLLWASQKEGSAKVWALWLRPKHALAMLVYALAGMMAVQLTFFLAIKHSNAATATILQFLSPVVIAVYLSLRTRKLPTKTAALAIALALLGTFFLVTHGRLDRLSLSHSALFWGVSSAFVAAFYIMYPYRLIRKWGAQIVIGWAMLIGGLVLSCLFPPWQVSGVWDIYTYAGVFYTVIPGSLVTFYLFLVGVQYIGGSKASILTSVEPLSAAIFSMLLLNVSFGMMDWLGTLCIITTVVLLASNKH